MAHATSEALYRVAGGGPSTTHAQMAVATHGEAVGMSYHPLRQLWRDLLSNRLSATSAVLLPTLLTLLFVAARLLFRALFWLVDRVNERRRGGARTADGRVVFAPFQDASFWEREYDGSPAPYEWYATFRDLRPCLDALAVRARDRVLHVGCGTSSLAADLYHEMGVTRVTNIDVSARALELATAAAASDRRGPAEMDFLLADVRRLQEHEHEPFRRGGAFELAIDKGTLDSLSCDTREGEANVAAALRQLRRALVPGGRLVVVTTVDAAECGRWFAAAGFEKVGVTHLVTRMSRRRVPVLPNDVYVLRAPADAALKVGGGEGGAAKDA
mmetsp:Transcript_15422/g.53561  ORF Transcript_15422/g.53561 Transcript_15422/m.53561 type:complete len:329 (-) Transcript_15422:150-1136(-)